MSTPDGISLILSHAGPVADARLEEWRELLGSLERPHELRSVEVGQLRHEIPKTEHPLVALVNLDRPHEPAELKKLLTRVEEIADPETNRPLDLVTSFRAGRPTPTPVRLAGSLWRGFWNFALDLGMQPPPGWLGWKARWHAWANRMAFGTRVRDVYSGMMIVRKAVLERFPVQSTTEFAQAEILAKANFLGCFLDEIPVQPKSPPDTSPSVWKDFRAVFSSPKFNHPAGNVMSTVIDSHQHYWKLDDDRFDYSFLKAEPLAVTPPP